MDCDFVMEFLLMFFLRLALGRKNSTAFMSSSVCVFLLWPGPF